MRKYISVVLSHLACGSLSWQLWETNSAWKWKIILDIVKKKKMDSIRLLYPGVVLFFHNGNLLCRTLALSLESHRVLQWTVMEKNR